MTGRNAECKMQNAEGKTARGAILAPGKARGSAVTSGRRAFSKA